MINIKEYIISIIAIAAIGTFALMIAPDGEGGGIKRYIKLIVGLSAIIVVTSPIFSLIDRLSELKLDSISISQNDREEYESIFQMSYETIERENLKSGIKSALYDKFSIKEDECEIELTTRDGKICRVLVRLYGSAVWCDSGEIEKYLGGLLGCEVVTAIG